MNHLEFIPSKPFTIGAELEFQLLHPNTCDLTPNGPTILEKIDPSFSPYIKAEFIQSMVEICTPVCRDMAEVEKHLLYFCKKLDEVAKSCDCIPFASSLHPFGLIKDRAIYPSARYQEIMQDLQLCGRRMMTQALHIHIGLDDRDKAIKVCDSIRNYLPILLALTTSSPFLEGEDTGFYSYRSNLFCCLPRTGIPETLGSWHRFEKIIHILNQATILNGIKEIWWDVRPHPDFGTIEIRICDLPSKMSHILAIIALVQALVCKLSSEKKPIISPREIIMHNKWHASRYGMDGTFIRHKPGQHPSFRHAALELIDFTHCSAKQLGSAHYLDALQDILKKGTSAHRQKELYFEHRNFRKIINIMLQEFWD